VAAVVAAGCGGANGATPTVRLPEPDAGKRPNGRPGPARADVALWRTCWTSTAPTAPAAGLAWTEEHAKPEGLVRRRGIPVRGRRLADHDLLSGGAAEQTCSYTVKMANVARPGLSGRARWTPRG